MTTGARPSAFERLEPGLATGLGVALALLVGLAPYWPTHDGPQHVLHATLWNHLHDPGPAWDTMLQRGTPITAWGFLWVFAPLEGLVGWQRAHQLTLALFAVGGAAAFRSLVERIAGRRHPLGLLGFGVALGWCLYLGFLPFVGAAAAGLGVAAWTSAPRPLRALEWVGVSACLFLVAMMHVMPAALFGVAVFILRLGATHGRRRVIEGAAAVVAGLPALGVAAAAAAAGSETVASVGGENHVLWHAWGTRLVDLAMTGVGGPAWRAWPPTIAAIGGALAVAASAARGRMSARGQSGSTSPGGTAVAAALVALLAVALALALPFHTTAWEFLSPRPLVLLVPFGVAALASLLPRRWDIPVTAAVCAFVAASLTWSGRYGTDLAASLPDPQAAAATTVAEQARGGWLLPLGFDVHGQRDAQDVAYGAPLGNAGHLLAIELGAMTPYLFATSPSMHPHAFLPGVGPSEVPRRSYFAAGVDDDPRHAMALRDTLLRAGAAYDAVAAWGDDAIVARMRERGFRVAEFDDGAALGTFEGCPLTLRIQGGERSRVTSVSTAWFPLLDRWTPVALQQQGMINWRAHTDSAPCGDVWVRLEAGTSEGPASCRGADAEGRILVRLTPDSDVVECVLSPLAR
jgi:hypothetical protein